MKPLMRGPIARRLFLFNILIVFMPVAGFFSLSLFEDSQLSDLENSMVQQGRIIAAWLEQAPLNGDRAKAVLASLKRKHTARIRIVDAEGYLLADSSGTLEEKPVLPPSPYPSPLRTALESAKAPEEKAETTILYRVLSFPIRFARKYLAPPETPLESADFYSGKTRLDGIEVNKALSGSYGAITRISSGGQTSVTLYSAIPVGTETGFSGAVLVSQSTFRILSSLYAFRLEIGKVFVWSLVAAGMISLLLACTISRPLSRLRKEAESVIDGSGIDAHIFHLTGRDDEIDRLSASLSSLVRDLRAQARLSENFALDAAHEMRNRIAGIRTSAELIRGGGIGETEAAIDLILENVGRMDKVIAALRELSKIEAGNVEISTGNPFAIASGVVGAMRSRHPGLSFAISVPEPLRSQSLPVSPEHFEIVLDNLLENAASFSPPGGTVSLEAVAYRGRTSISVRDRGTGIPEEHLNRVFERFFSWRADGDGLHAGIGLSLVEAIMRKAGGSVSCSNNPSGGAVFTLYFPAS